MISDYVPMSEIDALVVRACDVWREAEHQSFLVKPSIPILWFGDVEAYRRSPRRIVTVGLNPSRAEFPEADRFRRFPRARVADPSNPTVPAGPVCDSLNEYFRCDPYRNWFQAFEPLLNGMGASFYDGPLDRAVHTDLCSPLATDPTWSGMSVAQKWTLEGAGVALWHDLIRALRPHMMLISVAERYLDRVAFPAIQSWHVVFRVERANPYTLRAATFQIDANHKSICVYGRAAQKPFGLISDAEKRRAGRILAEMHDE